MTGSRRRYRPHACARVPSPRVRKYRPHACTEPRPHACAYMSLCFESVFESGLLKIEAVDKCPAPARGKLPRSTPGTPGVGSSSPPGDELIPLDSSSSRYAALASLHPCRRGAELGRKQGRHRLLVDAPRTHQNALRCGFCVWARPLGVAPSKTPLRSLDGLRKCESLIYMTLPPPTFAAAAPAGPVGRAPGDGLPSPPQGAPRCGGCAATLLGSGGRRGCAALADAVAGPAAVIFSAVGLNVLRGAVGAPAAPAGLWPFGCSREASASRQARLTIPVALKGEGPRPSPAALTLGLPLGPQAAYAARATALRFHHFGFGPGLRLHTSRQPFGPRCALCHAVCGAAPYLKTALRPHPPLRAPRFAVRGALRGDARRAKARFLMSTKQPTPNPRPVGGGFLPLPSPSGGGEERPKQEDAIFSHPYLAGSPQKGPAMQNVVTSTTELVFALEREYAAALTQAAIYGAQSSRWVDSLTVAKREANLASLKAYAASLDQALQAARAKLPASCRKPEND